jgi:hypothetical protein
MRVPNFFRDNHGDVQVAQWPNPAIAVAIALWTASALVDSHAAVLRDASTGALIAWAADELARGASPFRRLLGAVVLGWALYSLAQR